MSRRTVLTGMVVVLALSGGAAGAEAATVTRTYAIDPTGSPYGDGFVLFKAAPGEANDLEISIDGDAVTFRDARAPVETDTCERVDPSTVRCQRYDDVTVALGDGDDAVRVADSRPPAAPDEPDPTVARIEAGTGADAVTGGPQAELIVDRGQGESDRFSGGGGLDTVSYDGRRTPVRVQLGKPGEDVLEGIAGVVGGSAADVLRGSAGADVLSGGPGDDRIEGRGGDDVLEGDAGADRLFGGGGDDRLDGDYDDAAPDHLDGGAGDDELDLSVLVDQEVISIGGTIFALERDRERDTARCGSGIDMVDWLEQHDSSRGCEAGELEAWKLGRRLTRTRGGSLRLRVYPGDFRPIRVRVALVPRRGKPVRLTRPAPIRRSGTIALRLTPAGRRYLRRGGEVTIRGLGWSSDRLNATVG